MTVAVTLEEAREWIGVSSANLTDDQLQRILDGETAIQAGACRIDPAAAQPALEQALLRRVGRAVNARGLPGGYVGDPTLGVSRLPTYDAEIERMERPYRLVVAG